MLFGRGSGCINTGGEKVFPEEVEAAIRAHPDVFDAVVVGVPDPRFGQKVVALVKVRDGRARPDARRAARARPRPARGLQDPACADPRRGAPHQYGKPDYATAQRIALEHTGSGAGPEAPNALT